MELDSETLGFDSESSKQVSGFAIEDTVFLESKALFKNPKPISSSVLLHVDAGLLLGGLICRDKSGCAGKSSMIKQPKKPFSTSLYDLIHLFVVIATVAYILIGQLVC